QHCGEPLIATINGPLRFGGEPWALSAKKLLRQLIAARLLSAMTFASVHLLERVIPESQLLQRVYDLVVGAYIQKGWREGLRLYRAELPHQEWTPVSAK